MGTHLETTQQPLQKAPPQNSKRSYLAALLATGIDHYDVALYGFMAPVVVKLFLPMLDTLYGLIFAYCITPLGMLSRPLGALVIGRMGDKWGRKKALSFAVWGMAIATGTIGFLPTYEHIGPLAPISFGLLRLVQDFFLGGGYNGGAIFMLEHVGMEQKGLWSGIYCSATVLGILMASSSATLVAYLPEGYWRIPFLCGFFTSFVALYIRRKAQETPEFLQKKEKQLSLFLSIKEYKRSIICAILAAFFFATITKVVQIFMNVFILQITSIPLKQVMAIHTGALVVFLIALPFFGKLADRLGLGRSMLYGTIATMLLSFPLFKLLMYNSVMAVIGMKIILVLLSAWFVAPFHAWMQSLFTVKSRYTLISFSYAIGARIGSCMIPLLMYICSQVKLVYAPCFLLAGAAILGMIGVTQARKEIYAKA